MLENSLDTTKRLDDIGSVGVEIPQLPVVTLAGPPEWIALHELIGLELSTSPKPLIEAQRAPIFLEQRINTRQAAVPAVLQILKG